MSTPTPEYIEHLMAPERKEFRERLNEEWKPEVGDWVWLLQDHEVALVYRFALGVVDSLITEGNETRFHGRGRHGCCWLPSLSQLLDMVLEAGWSPMTLTHIPAHIPGEPETEEEGWEMGAVEIASLAGDQEDHVEFSDECKEPKIAAVSLLERLWEVG